MDRKRGILYMILIIIPVIFGLFLLALVNVLLMLAGIIALLIVMVVLKQKKPELFDFLKRPEKKQAQTPTTASFVSERISQREQQQQVYLVLSGSDSERNSRIIINKPTFVIGRALDNDYVVDDARIGRHHLRIEYNLSESVAYAVDLGSQNGNYLNSERMLKGQRYRLIDGDQVMINDRPYVVDYAHY